MTPFLRIGEQTDILGECPLWDEREQALYWVDIRAPAIRRFTFVTGRIESWAMPGPVGSIALAEVGHLLVALPDRLAYWKIGTDQFETLAVPHLISGHRFNDGRCDRQGRFWVGTMHNETRAPEGVLYRLEKETLEPVLSGIRIPNSLSFSPDGCTMYFADSLEYTISAYDYDPATGGLGTKTKLAETKPPAFPDGSAIDAEGYLWNAEFNGGRLVRYAPNGCIDRIVRLPVMHPTCCTFGGMDLDILFVTTTSQKMTDEERKAAPLAGSLLAMNAGVAGLPESQFNRYSKARL